MDFRFSIFDLRLNARRRRGGFSFTEVLFAIFILAIGFIMIAAMFPVAIRQTQSTAEETSAAVMSRGAVNAIQQITLAMTAYTPLPVTDLLAALPAVLPDRTQVEPGKVVSFRDNRLPVATRDATWNALKGNLILPSDPRYAWVGMYRRDGVYTNPGGSGVVAGAAAYAQLVMVGVQARNRSVYESGKDLVRYPSNLATDTILATLEPMLLTNVDLAHPASGADTLTFNNIPAADAQKIASGAVVVVSNDGTAAGTFNGHVYQLGNAVNATTWQLSTPRPVDDSELAPGGALLGMDVFVVGRGYQNPASPASGYEGNIQDIAVYTTFVRF